MLDAIKVTTHLIRHHHYGYMSSLIQLGTMISEAEAILLVTDGSQVRSSYSDNECTVLLTQDHTREYFMDKLTAHYSTLPIHTVAYHCDDDRLACTCLIGEHCVDIT